MDSSAKPSTSIPSTNPPSVEIAYKRKCIGLKKRLNEIEAENELMRVRNKRGWKYIQKMRLESCILLERLANVTGMAEEAQTGVNPELRERAAAMMSNMVPLNGATSHGNGAPYFDDETEGSSEEQPPTPQPQERPLRIKRSRKSTAEKENEGWDEGGHGPGHPSTWRSEEPLPRPTQEEMTSSFRVQTGNNSGNGNGNSDPAVNRDDSSYSRPTGQEPARNGTVAEGPLGPAADILPSTTTPMDMDTKEPKVESQG